jgi:hypothetical protein
MDVCRSDDVALQHLYIRNNIDVWKATTKKHNFSLPIKVLHTQTLAKITKTTTKNRQDLRKQ